MAECRFLATTNILLNNPIDFFSSAPSIWAFRLLSQDRLGDPTRFDYRRNIRISKR